MSPAFGGQDDPSSHVASSRFRAECSATFPSEVRNYSLATAAHTSSSCGGIAGDSLLIYGSERVGVSEIFG